LMGFLKTGFDHPLITKPTLPTVLPRLEVILFFFFFSFFFFLMICDAMRCYRTRAAKYFGEADRIRFCNLYFCFVFISSHLIV
jgi:hypothetical protein